MPPGATGSRFSTCPDVPERELQAPGGTVETDEDIATAALREFYEETGI
ncbi:MULTISPECIES: NUDIX domain-containing protein [unclassified Rhizobium]|nr:8-oxo-dGTP pyrophosphatase MutT (NUDIX family) [Rhizobium sp. BK399]MCS3741125.1 8-oxo-dGTP pyrophosphatase MutT (NUDIX family) [Rhizobium sp. BK661]MCS4093289.1 8-oxo-dGTP pyrophosphatase MutT (NUDIX family) [Rhizobium sp. BK176]